MKNLALGVIFSLLVTIGSIASVSADLNFPDKKKKSKKECKSDSKKSCCPSSNGEMKDCGKKSEAK